MIHWTWLLAALWGGVVAGIFIAALFKGAGRDYDDEVQHPSGQHV